MRNLITKHLDIWTAAHKTRSIAGRGSNNKLDLVGIKKLRELILELAVRGKLVPQDPNDEPASELLKKIRNEKARLVRDGAIKKNRDFPVITNEEYFFDLPIGWEWARLEEVGRDWGQKTPEATFTYIDVSAIDNTLGKIVEPTILSAEDAPSRARKIISKGTVIYSTIRPYLQNIAVIENDFSPEAIASTAFAILHPLLAMPAKYFSYYLRSPAFISYVESVQTGIAYPAINDKQFYSGVVPIPPLPEQHRIVAKVDELMAFCDQLEQTQSDNIAAHAQLVEALLATLTDSRDHKELQNNWQRIAAHFDTLFTTEHSIEQLKKTILQLAVMGKLVPQNPNDEPASELLKKIATEKAELIKEGKIKKEKPLPEITDEEKPFELAKGWEWARLGNITDIKGGKRVSNGYKLLKTPTPYIYIRVTDFKDGTIADSDLHYIDEKMREKIGQYIISKDDLYMTIVGATIGKCGLVPPNFDNMNLTENAARLVLSKFINKIFILKSLTSSFCQSQFFDKTKQVGVQKMALNRLSSSLIPLPPLTEQHRIVAKVDELISLCDTLKTNLQNAQTTQLALAQALVEQAVN